MTAAAPTEMSAVRWRMLLGGWVDAVLTVAAHYKIDVSPERIRTEVQWMGDHQSFDAGRRDIARQAGLAFHLAGRQLSDLTPWRLPVVVQLQDGQVGVVTAITKAGLCVIFSGDRGAETVRRLEELQPAVEAVAVLRPLQSAPDSRVDDYIRPVQPHWMRRLVLGDWRPYVHILLASLIYNLMALAGTLFSMQVYDRVVPAQSEPTLYVLFGGVLLSIAASWSMRSARMRITDVLGKRADLRISDRVFGHALRVRSDARPRATGTFISQVRELEPVREMMTSTTVAAAADLPFFVLFCVIFWLIAGPLVAVPLIASVLLILPSLLAQPRLRQLSQEGMRESSLRSAMLVETVQGIDDIKLLQAEPRFQNQWNHYNLVSAESGLKLRGVLNALNNWSQTVQGAAFAFVVFFGAPLVMQGQMSTGVLVAASILVTRMLAPLASITQVLNRWQQARVAAHGLDELMKLPVDHPPSESRIHRHSLAGEYRVADAQFSHDGRAPVLQVKSLTIRPGERIAIIGRNGAGKSTLLRALSGLLPAMSGAVMLDGLPLAQLDPADVRRDVGLLTQEARLFHGTLRENLLLGAPHASDDELVAALTQAGAWSFVQTLSAGLDHRLFEGGLGLSGGQRQSLLLARLLVRDPRVLLLDEPTTALDEATERAVVASLGAIARGRTLIVATHRAAVLQAVDRILVVAGGSIVRDGPRDEILARLRAAAGGAAA